MEQAAEAAAAAAGGMFSAAALFPLEVIKTNLQAHIKNTDAAADNDELMDQSLVESSSPSESSRKVSPSLGDMGEESRGKGELEENDPSVASVARDIFHRESIPGFYNGVLYAASQSAVEKAAYFYGYGWLKALALRAGGGNDLSTLTDLGLGYLAEVFHLPFTVPVEVVLTKVITSKEPTNALAVIQGILGESGPGGFYKGIQAYVVLCLKPAIQYAVFNRLKAIALAYNTAGNTASGAQQQLSAVQAFVLGAISRAVATIIVYPYIRAKVILMSRSSGAMDSGKNPYSIFNSVVSILRDEGVSALFQGIMPEITRGVLSAALMLMVKEKIHAVVKGAIIGQKI